MRNLKMRYNIEEMAIYILYALYKELKQIDKLRYF